MSTFQEKKEPLVKVENLKMHFPLTKGLISRVYGHVKAVDDVSFEIYEGETFGLVGESGCGKTTTGKCVLRVLDPTDGKIWYAGKDIAKIPQNEMKQYRRELQMIFQDPQSSLNGRMKIRDIIAEGIDIHKLAKSKEEC